MTSITLSPEQERAVDEYLSASKPNCIKFAVFSSSIFDHQQVLTRISMGFYVDEYDPTDGGYRTQAVVRGRPALLDFDGICTGGESHSALVHHIARCEDAWMLMYNVASRSSFDAIAQLAEQLISPHPWNDDETLPALARKPLLVLATNADAPAARWEVPLQTGELFSQRVGARFMKVSPRTGEGLGPGDVENMVLYVLSEQWAREKAGRDEAARTVLRSRPAGQKRRWSVQAVSEKFKKLLKKDTESRRA